MGLRACCPYQKLHRQPRGAFDGVLSRSPTHNSRTLNAHALVVQDRDPVLMRNRLAYGSVQPGKLAPTATVKRRDVRSDDEATDVWDLDDRAAGWRLGSPRDG